MSRSSLQGVGVYTPGLGLIEKPRPLDLEGVFPIPVGCASAERGDSANQAAPGRRALVIVVVVGRWPPGLLVSAAEGGHLGGRRGCCVIARRGPVRQPRERQEDGPTSGGFGRSGRPAWRPLLGRDPGALRPTEDRASSPAMNRISDTRSGWLNPPGPSAPAFPRLDGEKARGRRPRGRVSQAASRVDIMFLGPGGPRRKARVGAAHRVRSKEGRHAEARASPPDVGTIPLGALAGLRTWVPRRQLDRNIPRSPHGPPSASAQAQQKRPQGGPSTETRLRSNALVDLERAGWPKSPPLGRGAPPDREDPPNTGDRGWVFWFQAKQGVTPTALELDLNTSGGGYSGPGARIRGPGSARQEAALPLVRVGPSRSTRKFRPAAQLSARGPASSRSTAAPTMALRPLLPARSKMKRFSAPVILRISATDPSFNRARPGPGPHPPRPGLEADPPASPMPNTGEPGASGIQAHPPPHRQRSRPRFAAQHSHNRRGVHTPRSCSPGDQSPAGRHLAGPPARMLTLGAGLLYRTHRRDLTQKAPAVRAVQGKAEKKKSALPTNPARRPRNPGFLRSVPEAVDLESSRGQFAGLQPTTGGDPGPFRPARGGCR